MRLFNQTLSIYTTDCICNPANISFSIQSVPWRMRLQYVLCVLLFSLEVRKAWPLFGSHFKRSPDKFTSTKHVKYLTPSQMNKQPIYRRLRRITWKESPLYIRFKCRVYKVKLILVYNDKLASLQIDLLKMSLIFCWMISITFTSVY